MKYNETNTQGVRSMGYEKMLAKIIKLYHSKELQLRLHKTLFFFFFKRKDRRYKEIRVVIAQY